jgi:hypothetical protein
MHLIRSFAYDGEKDMSTAVMTERIAEVSPRFRAVATAVFYLLTLLMGGLVLFVDGRWALIVDLIAGAGYLAVTALFYDLSKPVNRSLPGLAAFFHFVRSAAVGVSQRAGE